MQPNPFNEEDGPQPTPAPAEPMKPSQMPISIALTTAPSGNRRWQARAIVLVLAFGLGFLPMWLKAGRHAKERDAAQSHVKRLQLESVTAAAAMDARRGEYEPARQAISWFFTALQVELNKGRESSLSTAQKDALKPLLPHRDDLITLLARGDPVSADRLTEIYLICRTALRGT